MIDLMEKIEQLKKALDNTKGIKDIEKTQKEILADKKLYEQVLRKDSSLNQHEKIQKYRQLENEVNFLILEINNTLKENLKEGEKCHESN